MGRSCIRFESRKHRAGSIVNDCLANKRRSTVRTGSLPIDCNWLNPVGWHRGGGREATDAVGPGCPQHGPAAIGELRLKQSASSLNIAS